MKEMAQTSNTIPYHQPPKSGALSEGITCNPDKKILRINPLLQQISPERAIIIYPPMASLLLRINIPCLLLSFTGTLRSDRTHCEGKGRQKQRRRQQLQQQHKYPRHLSRQYPATFQQPTYHPIHQSSTSLRKDSPLVSSKAKHRSSLSTTK